jgi:hypothetical protein
MIPFNLGTFASCRRAGVPSGGRDRARSRPFLADRSRRVAPTDACTPTAEHGGRHRAPGIRRTVSQSEGSGRAVQNKSRSN